MKYMHKLYRSPDSQPGGGEGTANSAGADGDTSTAENEGNEPVRTLTQAEVDAVIKDRLARQEKKLRKELEVQRDAAAEEELAKAAEWQTLADKRKLTLDEQAKQIEELQAQAEKAKEYEAALSGYATALAAGLPAEILALLESMDVAERLKWLQANAAKFAADGSLSTPKTPSNPMPPTPKPDGKTELSPEERRARAVPTF